MAAIHIAFGDSAAANLKAAIRTDEYQESVHCFDFISNATVLNCSDRLALGPIFEMDLPSGFFERASWMASFLEEALDAEKTLDDVDGQLERISDFYKKLAWIEDDQGVVLWHGGSVTEQIGVRLVASLLPNCRLFEGAVLSEVLRESCPWDESAPRSLPECSPERIKALFASVKPVAANQLDQWRNDWQALIQSRHPLRVLTGAGIEGVELHYFDDALMYHCGQEPIKAAQVIGAVLAEGRCEAGDDFLSLRLKHLAERGLLRTEGDLGSAWGYTVCLNA